MKFNFTHCPFELRLMRSRQSDYYVHLALTRVIFLPWSPYNTLGQNTTFGPYPFVYFSFEKKVSCLFIFWYKINGFCWVNRTSCLATFQEKTYSFLLLIEIEVTALKLSFVPVCTIMQNQLKKCSRWWRSLFTVPFKAVASNFAVGFLYLFSFLMALEWYTGKVNRAS